MITRCEICNAALLKGERHNAEMCRKVLINAALESAAVIADAHFALTVGSMIRELKNAPRIKD